MPATRLNEQLRIGLLEFEPLRVAGLQSVFDEVPSVEVVPATVTEALEDTSFDIVMLGLQEPLASFDILANLRLTRPQLKLIVMGADGDEETIISAIAAGAKGYLEEKATPRQVIHCIEVVQSGSIWAPRKVLSSFVDRLLQVSDKPVPRHGLKFTERERQVLRLLSAAQSNREIALAMGIEESTVKSYVARLMQKVGVVNRIALTVRAGAYDIFGGEG
jgi:DNA-binding NarL/FixJ family response regulator